MFLFVCVPGMSFWGHSEKLEIFTVARWNANAVDSFRRGCLAEVLALVEDNRKNGTSQIAGKEGLKTLLGTDPNASDACWEDLPCNCGLGEECIKTKEHKAGSRILVAWNSHEDNIVNIIRTLQFFFAHCKPLNCPGF